MFSKKFLLDLIERSVKTFAQVLGAFLVANATGLLDTDWAQALSVSGLAALVSVLTSIGSGAITGTPSVGGENLTRPGADLDFDVTGDDVA